MVTTQAARRLRGAWYTPPELVDLVVGAVLDHATLPSRERRVTVLDPACGDGRFLRSIGDRLVAAGRTVHLTGCDIDADVVAAADACLAGRHHEVLHDDALTRPWGDARYDIVVGNPPFLSQLAAATTRGGSSAHGGGPYADAAVEFLALAVRLAEPSGGLVGFVLPQSILAARDARPVRTDVARLADLVWSWWRPDQRHFDANVNVCALALRRPGTSGSIDWTSVVTDVLGVPAAAGHRSNGTVGDRADLNANFRDEYYALVPAVSDHADGPPLVTSGLIDPGVCHWGSRDVRFAKRRFAAPRVDLSMLEGRFAAWAERKLVPKVLVANQTSVVEAVADPDGAWLPGVPVTAVTPSGPTSVWELAAVLTSPVASALAWRLTAGTGLSTRSMRVGPAVLAALPWPAGPLDDAVAALRDGDVDGCARHTIEAFGVGDGAAELLSWWSARRPGRP